MGDVSEAIIPDAEARCIRNFVVRKNEDILYDITSEYRHLSERLANLNSAIEADPQSVRKEHKDLWKKQAEYMEGYKKILADRIKDILEHN